jgi:hypothetical protein
LIRFGAGVGAGVGAEVGLAVGRAVGAAVGTAVGGAVGTQNSSPPELSLARFLVIGFISGVQVLHFFSRLS